MKHNKAISQSVDEYLEEMHRCRIEGRKTTTKGLSERLKISMPSVSQMLLKLNPRGSIVLTAKGKRAGALVCAKFETLNKFLLRLGFGKKQAEEEACVLEHAVSSRLERKLRKFI